MVRALLLINTLYFGCMFSLNASSLDTSQSKRLVAKDAVFRAPIPGMENSVGYLKLTNTQDESITLVSAESAISERVEFHNHLMENGVMKMVKVDRLNINANQTITFQSGGLHLMFLGLKSTVNDVSLVELNLITSTGKKIPVKLKVKSINHHSHH